MDNWTPSTTQICC